MGHFLPMLFLKRVKMAFDFATLCQLHKDHLLCFIIVLCFKLFIYLISNTSFITKLWMNDIKKSHSFVWIFFLSFWKLEILIRAVLFCTCKCHHLTFGSCVCCGQMLRNVWSLSLQSHTDGRILQRGSSEGKSRRSKVLRDRRWALEDIGEMRIIKKHYQSSLFGYFLPRKRKIQNTKASVCSIIILISV